MEYDLNHLLREICPYDSADTLASIAGLQLLPENADKSIRLEAFAYAAASLPEEVGKKCISTDKVNLLLNKSSFSRGPISLAEDPMPNPFTESITFLNGSYVVFPWNLEDSSFVFRQLIKALFYFTNPFPNSEFIKQATMLISACLLLSNEIAIRAGLKRDMDPISKDKKIYIHGKKTISKLKAAVSFSLSELETLLTENEIERNILDRLTIAPGSFSASKYQIEENNLLAKPIVKFKNKIVISIPGMLLPAARNEIILLAKEYGLDENLAMRYNLAVWGNIIESLGYLDNKIINMPKCNPLDISCGKDAFFYLDTDKLIYALMVTDQLINYESFFSEWPTDDLSHKIEARLEYIKGYIASFEQPLNDILFLVLIQGIGRRYVLGIGDGALPMQYPILGLSAADLETIALLEGGERLSLWNYACSKEIIRKNTFVSSIGELNEFYIYRKNDCSYYLSDKPRPKGLFIVPEGAVELRMEVLKKIRSHGVPSFHGRKMEEVIALHEKSKALSRNRVIFQLFQYHDRTHLPIATKVWYNFVSHTKITMSTS